MKEVRKKSADPAVNQMLQQAYKKHVTLTWDRADAMQPQCGFARLALCCSDCAAGPCRVSPFATEEQGTICGRDQQDLVAASLVKQVAAGSRALLQLAGEFGVNLDASLLQKVLVGDNMAGMSTASKSLAELGDCALTALTAIRQAKSAPTHPTETHVNLGTLPADQPNIIIYGHVSPTVVSSLANAVEVNGVNLLSMAGNEVSGQWNLPIVTNYDSQETPLLTGAVDLLVMGSQCVMPAVPKLAAKLGIPCTVANQLKNPSEVDAAVQAALSHFQARANHATAIPQTLERLVANYTVENSGEIIKKLVAGYSSGQVQGLAYFGGCGNIANTQDSGLISLASSLSKQGYLLVTAGCAGTALAKAGLCDPAKHKVSGTDLPAVLHVGACHDAAVFLGMAAQAAENGLPVFAVFTELVHQKMLATALAFAVAGITVYADLDWAFGDEAVAEWLQHGLQPTGGSIVPLSSLAGAK